MPEDYSFIRYLAAKKTVDDRALNRPVWEALRGYLADWPSGKSLRLLEVGSGIGTMIERLLEHGMLVHSAYSALDAVGENITAARERLLAWAGAHAVNASLTSEGGMALHGETFDVVIDLVEADVFDLIAAGSSRWDGLIANAFLDLIDVPSTLPELFRLLNPGGFFYFSINFDGLTLFEPAIDSDFDGQIERLYHRTMDERQAAGKLSGDSRAGRHLFEHIRKSGGRLLAAGASDWVVYPGKSGYPRDEAYFLHYIIHTVHQALLGCPELNPNRFEAWIARRHEQVQRNELVYIAHQLDFFGRVEG